MSDCCSSTTPKSSQTDIYCPSCKQKGKPVPLITLKSMLKPVALESINAETTYAFCSIPSCEVVYFNHTQSFSTDTLKVAVFQKNETMNVPVCYCFGWTRERLIQAIQDQQRPTEHIREQVQANRCGCEVNNPQGSCCLGNVTSYIRSIDKS